ncbi:MAG: hypothetical protein ACYDDW_01920 [Dermatophilaceae bacterium]
MATGVVGDHLGFAAEQFMVETVEVGRCPTGRAVSAAPEEPAMRGKIASGALVPVPDMVDEACTETEWTQDARLGAAREEGSAVGKIFGTPR